MRIPSRAISETPRAIFHTARTKRYPQRLSNAEVSSRLCGNSPRLHPRANLASRRFGVRRSCTPIQFRIGMSRASYGVAVRLFLFDIPVPLCSHILLILHIITHGRR